MAAMVKARDQQDPREAEQAPTRERLIEAASELFRRQGLAATGIKQILTASGAQFSSLYHHFPEGKDQLAAEAIFSAGMQYQRLVESVWDGGGDIYASVAAVFEGAALALELTDYADACPIGTVALEVASTNERLRVSTEEVFASWIDGATTRLVDAGVHPVAAHSAAQSIIALLEGAFILSRAAKSTEAMHAAGDAAVTLVQAALATEDRSKKRAATPARSRARQ